MGACQIIIIVLHLLIIPLKMSFFFHRHVFLFPCFFPFKCFVIYVNHYFDGHIENMVFILTLFICCIIMCYRYEIKNLLLLIIQ